MAATSFFNATVMAEGHLIEHAELVIDADRIVFVGQAQTKAASQRIDLEGRYILPGLIDVQVNGGGGVLFNMDPTPEGIATIAEAHARHGTTALLPTFVTDHLEKLDVAIAAVEKAIAAGAPGIIGIHIEGPFLAAEKKGAHDASKFLPLSAEHLDRITALKGGTTLITIAPEAASNALVTELCKRGARIAIGHSNATMAQAQAALDAGVTGFTHLYNSMSPLLEGEPGCVGAALSDARAFCGIIADGRHVEPELLRIAYSCKGPARLMLVTDAMPCVGMRGEHRAFEWEGKTYTARDGACFNDSGILSGSDLNMMQAVRNAVRFLDTPLTTAVSMASRTPADFLGLAGFGALAPGARADFIIVDANLNVVETWIAGRRVF